jgi:hypothetical protein
LVFGFGHYFGSIGKMMSEMSIPCSIGAILSVQAIELPYQLLQFLVFTFAQMVLELNSLRFNFLCRAVWSFAFIVRVP